MQQRFRSEKRNICTEEIDKICLILHDDKRMQSIESIETLHTEQVKIQYVRKKKFNKIVKQYKNVYL